MLSIIGFGMILVIVLALIMKKAIPVVQRAPRNSRTTRRL